MIVRQWSRRIINFCLAIVYVALIAISAVGFPIDKASADVITEPVSPGDSCLWMGEMSYEMKVNNTFIGSGYSRTYEYVSKHHMVSSPVQGEACGAIWSATSSLTQWEYEDARCTPDQNDINTRTSTQIGNGTGTGNYIAGIIASGTYPGQYFLRTSHSPLTTNGSVDYNYSNDLCGGSGNDTFGFGVGGLLSSICVTSPSSPAYDKVGFFVNPTSQSSVGSCERTVGSSETNGSHEQYEKLEWRMRKVDCNQSIDSDNGGVSDCLEYEAKTNPMDASDDVQLDNTKPTITLNAPLNGGTILLGSNSIANFSCQDEVDGSGLANCESSVANGSILDTSTVGTKTFEITATDYAGNETTATASYTVAYQHSGFLGPIDSNAINKAKAGATVPVQFRLLDGNGNPISSPASFVSLTSAGTTCNSSEPADAIEQYTGGSGLQYLGDGNWQYNWKTAKSYAGQCRIIYLNLADGSKVSAKFQF